MRFVNSTNHNEMRIFLCWIIFEEFGEDALTQDFAKNSKQHALIRITYNFESNQISVKFRTVRGFLRTKIDRGSFIEAISSVNAIFFYEPLRCNFWVLLKNIRLFFSIGAKGSVKYTSEYIKENYPEVLEKLKDETTD